MAQKSPEERQATTIPSMLTGTAWPIITEYQREVLGFLSKRLAKDADLLRQLQACRSWEDAAVLQSNWAQDTFTNYSEEAARLLNITSVGVGNGAAQKLRLVA